MAGGRVGGQDDLTVVDAQNGQVLKKVPAGGFAVRFMPSASAALVVASNNPDATLAAIQGTSGVMVVNAVTGKLVGTLVPFKKVVDMAIDWGARR